MVTLFAGPCLSTAPSPPSTQPALRDQNLGNPSQDASTRAPSGFRAVQHVFQIGLRLPDALLHDLIDEWVKLRWCKLAQMCSVCQAEHSLPLGHSSRRHRLDRRPSPALVKSGPAPVALPTSCD